MQTQSLLRSMGIAVTFALTLFVMTSCTKDDGGSSAKSGARKSGSTLDDLREDVLAFKEEAEEAGASKYAKALFAKGEKYLTDADELIEDEPGKVAKIRNKLNQARTNFKTAVNRSEKNKEEFEKTESVKKQYLDLIAKKDEAKSTFRTLDPDGWKQAQEKHEEALELLEDGKPRDAHKRMKSALSSLKNSISRADRIAAAKQQAEDARAKMTAVKTRALEAKAKEHAAGDLTYAEEQERLAIRKLEEGDFSLAENYFLAAESYFAQALTMAQAKVTSTTSRGSGDLAGGPSGGNSRGNDRETYQPAPKVDKVKPPSGDDYEDLDLDVASAISQRLNGSPDFKGDILRLEYSTGSGPDLKKDVSILQGKVGRHVLFEGIEGVGIADYLMGGNSNGYLLLEPVFKDKVRVEVEFQSQLSVGATPTFQMLLMANGAKDYYGSHFGTNILISNDAKGVNQVPSANKEFHQHVNKWLNRREPVRMRFEYSKKDEESKGMLRVFHGGEEVCRKETDFYRKGRVGFRWSNTKFYLTELIVTGQIDEEWAASFTKEQNKKGADTEPDDDFDF